MDSISTLPHKHIFAIALLIASLSCNAQQRDSLLMHETTLSRPLIVHHQQLRISGGYNFEIHNAEFVGTKRIRLSRNNRAGVGNRFHWLIEYGILENLQVSVGLTRLSQTIRYENATVVDDPVYDIFYSQETTGWTDPELSLTWRLPLPRRVDILVAGNYTFPMMAHGNSQPQHRIVSNEGWYTINYVDRQGVGSGVATIGWSASGKYRFSNKVATVAQFSYMAPQGVSAEKRWYFTLVDDDHFLYESTDHQRQVPDLGTYSLAVEYQASPTFNMYTGMVVFARRYGWSDVSGEKVKIPDQRYSALRLGYEIIATPGLWLSQFLELPVGGENTPAPVVINTRIRYNVMW